ncbi:histidine kinase dimerization/phosphoacceptor domain-containing protein [Streptomyces mirabilis]|uniref:histidine kinase dimerization/phosphoacceptor domain-containing protein n=1 Tax=Streptomyces mirabilis TaxID=68239 RepID=UPI002259A8E9|nr:histidine kinase dimerization/phosphoacceptor domain-containing protein [Streptomyces mirabilis]MCX4430041.1 histidine kinase dimerization/phosphoacceptor domain-containing protein [Streptomyces mirabilis]
MDENQTVVKAQNNQDEPVAPLWVRRPEALHLIAYSVAALVFTGQIAAVILRGSDWPTALSVLLAGGGVALSWWRPWAGLVVTSAASFAVTAVGHDPLSVWMMAVLVLFSVTLRGKQPLAGTGIVAAFFLGAFMTLGGFRGGAIVGAAALFSAIAGGATGAALRIHREHWRTLEERAESAIATREIEATRRVTEERLRIARDLHDVIGHQVAMLSLHLGAAEIGLPADAESSRQARSQPGPAPAPSSSKRNGFSRSSASQTTSPRTRRSGRPRRSAAWKALSPLSRASASTSIPPSTSPPVSWSPASA